MSKTEPEKLDLRSHDIAADKQAALRAAFPEVFTEGGKIDFEQLKLALGESIDSGKERYGMNWPGKADSFKTIQQPSMATLIPVKSESVDWDGTENLIIEGDNLEVLKLLQKSYLGRVKMIYIDPPYNTGSDFIYPDNYAESLDTYLSRWRCGPESYKRLVADGLVEWKKTDDEGQSKWTPYQKFYLEGRKKQPSNLWSEIEGNKKASIDVKNLLGDKVFDFPKPVELIQRCLTIGSAPDALILDFFAGSGTTAHAVLAQNKEDGGTRRFILVQLPEPTEREDFPTISEITKERVRRVIKKLNDEDSGKLELASAAMPDRGFKVFKLQCSNFKTWNAEVPKEEEALTQQLEMHVRHIVEGRAQEDILFEILLKSGFPPTSPVEMLTLAGQTVFSIAEGTMLICLEKTLSPEVIKEMAARKPERVVCLDEGFAGTDPRDARPYSHRKRADAGLFQQSAKVHGGDCRHSQPRVAPAHDRRDQIRAARR